ncbi:hypothetical protein SJA_C1-03420 [Sphingobium indicum UT26S]|uniref:Uncharacterized protein n=1 Tax=Sphingobium indicum (strain DSM 16413 / CCM 7287 / MTCC 6362 / UT26 / NBRC 101211 / UT26S) TaxID=452662 RepID=D4YXU4_SPHIU|nr:hypothetical protein SJA_C1-03420 [Sphingobium indicum UT26S]
MRSIRITKGLRTSHDHQDNETLVDVFSNSGQDILVNGLPQIVLLSSIAPCCAALCSTHILSF